MPSTYHVYQQANFFIRVGLVRCQFLSHICDQCLFFSLIDSREKLVIDIDTRACKGSRNYVRYLEHTHIVISLAHASRGAVSIDLVSPMGTRSRVLGRRKGDIKRGSFKNWAFLSTHFWGENPYGTWKLEIESKPVLSYLMSSKFLIL